MNAPAPIAPPTGDYAVIAVGKGATLGAVAGPFADRDAAVRALRRQPGPAVLVRGASVLEGVRIPSPSTMALLRQRLAERGLPASPDAPEEAPAPKAKRAPAADEEAAPPPEAPAARPEKALRVARPKPVPAGHCAGCGEPGPLHLTVCPLAPAALPPSAAGGVTPATAAPRACGRCGEEPPDHLLGCPAASGAPTDRPEETDAMTTKKTPTNRPAPKQPDTAPSPARCGAKGCADAPASSTERTRPELRGFCGTHRQRAYERAGRWGVDLAVAARTVAEGTSERPAEAAPSRKGQRPGKPAAGKPGAKAKAPAPRPARLADPTDVLVAELRGLLDGYVGARLDEARVRGIVDERLAEVLRKALAVKP